MDDTIITTYYLCEEFLKAIGHRDDRQVRLSTAEVMCYSPCRSRLLRRQYREGPIISG